jgi:hypothetical protein
MEETEPGAPDRPRVCALLVDAGPMQPAEVVVTAVGVTVEMPYFRASFPREGLGVSREPDGDGPRGPVADPDDETRWTCTTSSRGLVRFEATSPVEALVGLLLSSHRVQVRSVVVSLEEADDLVWLLNG